MRISDWSSDVCSSDLLVNQGCIGGAMRRGGKIVAKVGGDLSGRALEFRDPAVEQRPTRFQAEAVPIIVEQAQSDLQIDAVEDRLADIDAEIGRASCRERVCQ